MWSYTMSASIDSIKQARDSRSMRAYFKDRVRSGDLSLSAALRLEVGFIGDMPTYELLKALPYIGNPRLAILNDKAMKAGVNLFLPVVVLTERQRKWLCYN